MSATVTPITGQFGDRTGSAIRLTAGNAIAEVLPFIGFNCVRWDLDGDPVLFAEPPDTPNPSPTRSGHPILFPFPNRMRNGRFTFEGREYQLPLNDSTKTHAIHGITPRNPWRVAASGSDAESAFVTGEFQLFRDLPEVRTFWPADFNLAVTYCLRPKALRVEAVVTNPDKRPLPFGLGYHPYFANLSVRSAGEPQIDGSVLQVGSNRVWESVDLLPNGRVVHVPESLDFTSARQIGPAAFDHVFTDLADLKPDGLRTLAKLSSPTGGRHLVVRADAAYRELVLFTPTHRKAIAIEPYTCATDAANLDGRGISAGWRVLHPGNRFIAEVEYWVEDRIVHS